MPPVDPASSIRYVTCSGGGAKGMVYPGAYKALLDTGVYTDIEAFSGASAGAIIATFMAINTPIQQVREQLLNKNLADLLGDPVSEKGPGVVSIGDRIVTTSGEPLFAFLRENINKSIKQSLAELERVAKENENVRNRIMNNALLHTLFKRVRETSENELKITFGDLNLLNQAFPKQFKRLIIPAVRFPGGEFYVFNKNTPDVEIASACRATVSMPVRVKPHPIVIDGKEQLFVDAGYFDNIPTDYFHDDEDEPLIDKKGPTRTLVFAFGEGLNNTKNSVFQALYGHRVEETIANNLIEKLTHQIFATVQQANPSPRTAKEELKLFQKAISSVIKKEEQLNPKEKKILHHATLKAVRKFLFYSNQKIQSWSDYNNADNTKKKAELFLVIKNLMKPILHRTKAIDRWIKQELIKQSGLNTSYKYNETKEEGYQKLRSFYPLRTIELRVGQIKTMDFKKARALSRVLDTVGYLDTVNHIYNHDLHDPEQFNPAQLFADIKVNFEAIYKAILLGSGKDPRQDMLLKKINSLQRTRKTYSEESINREIYYLIKEKVEKNFSSPEAFALSRAVEYRNKNISSEQLFKEVYEKSFKHSRLFSISNITGKTIMTSAHLHTTLQKDALNMFGLYKQRESKTKQTRTKQIFTSLSQLEGFTEDYNQYKSSNENNLHP